MRSEADVDVLVVGAGAVGLACAAVLARRRSVVVVERHARPIEETSSRNSGVIHAGLYYPPGSLKARVCVRGRALLYARCARLGVAHRRLGKLVVATNAAEEARLERLRENGLRNGAGALRMVGRGALARMEPHVRARAALWSPQSGIVDAYELASSYRAEAEAHGAQIAFRSDVIRLERHAAGWRVEVQDADARTFALVSRYVVNAAGLAADRIAELAGIDVDAAGLRQHPCKGSYFGLAPRLRGCIRHLVYPIPEAAGLGIHVTPDLGGGLTAGPDARYVERVEYSVDEAARARFGTALRRYLPQVRDEDLHAGYAGVRPKLQGPGEGFRDFVVHEASRYGAPGLLNLIGIESPGLTSSEALAEQVVRLLERGADGGTRDVPSNAPDFC